DDEEEVRKTYIRAIKRFNSAGGKELFLYYEVKSLEEALETIKEIRFDAAIVDLNLNKTEKSTEGNQAIKSLIENFRMPIFVVSAYLDGLEELYKDTPLIISKTKGKIKTQELLEEILKELHSHVMQFYARNGFLEKKINEFYWSHLSHTFESWEELAKDISKDELDVIISRHTLMGINEELYKVSPKYHPAETYIIPSIKEEPHTGNILEKEGEYYINITPACDIAERAKLGKLSNYSLVKIESVYNIDVVKSKATIDKQISYVRDTLKRNQTERYHYLPHFNIIPESVIDFQSVINIKQNEIENYKSKASITMQFLKDIQNRYSSYLGRQGQPNYV
ncbi:response regulator, partial [Aliarcobacter butzleri]|uniref:response regulator n=1 Tax=Aliarcobacter butzleri TaxID=28197 RepID=UPI00263C72F3